jgi:4'-phosphopantetheinyl transferase EntD
MRTSGSCHGEAQCVTIEPNPARISVTLAGLFPAGVIATELRSPASPASLTSEERASVAHCDRSRILDFAAGRTCARRALQEFGVSDFSLMAAADRQPLWPPALTGSITHTDGYSAAVVGERRLVHSLGVDAELIDAVRADLWPSICTSMELEILRGLGVARRPLAAALIFVAKEAFFKCQFPVTGAMPGFNEAMVESRDWGKPAGSFRIVPAWPDTARPQFTSCLQGDVRWEGRFRRCHEFMMAGMALPASREALSTPSRR